MAVGGDTYPRKRKINPWFWFIALVAVAGASWGGYWWTHRIDPSSFITAAVDRGPIVRAITATGTVNPVTTVQVGTYVSGPIMSIGVDFNSPVKAGQLLARIDPRPFAAQLALAHAQLANSRAQLTKDQANLAYQKVTFERDSDLIKTAVISQDALDSQRSTVEQARAQIGLDEANIQQQQASVQVAELNLNYTNIVSPVDGVVVSRNVDVGQTVAASYETPTLFLVARDLTKMQADTNVSESDVGGVRQGQSVDFTVDAYNDRVFKGIVTQVRQAPITVQNVVTYDVVVSVPNPEMLLMPGMTANITIQIDRRDDVLRVPLRALAFSPHRGLGNHAGRKPRNPNSARVWVLGTSGLHPVRFIRGLDDGNYVEVVSGNLHPGDEVVTDEVRAGSRGSHNSMMAGPGGVHMPHM
jgi:HlyD family secretion protein